MTSSMSPPTHAAIALLVRELSTGTAAQNQNCPLILSSMRRGVARGHRQYWKGWVMPAPLRTTSSSI